MDIKNNNPILSYKLEIFLILSGTNTVYYSVLKKTFLKKGYV